MGADFVGLLICCIAVVVLFPVIIPSFMHTGVTAPILYTT